MKLYLIAIIGAAYSIRKIVYMLLATIFFIALVSAKKSYYDLGVDGYFFSYNEFWMMFGELTLFVICIYSFFIFNFLIKFSLENIRELKIHPQYK